MESVSQLVPLPALLPDSPSEEPFTATQWTTLMSLMDTVIPSIQRGSIVEEKGSPLAVTEADYDKSVDILHKTLGTNAPDVEAFDKYLNEKASDNPQFEAILKRSLGQNVPEKARKGLAFIMSALNTRLGSLLLTGYSTPIHEQPIRVRQAIIGGWQHSYLPPLNVIYKSVTALGKNLWLRTSPLYRELSGVTRAPEKYQPTTGFGFDFLEFGPGSEPEVIETDVVIVGSGCGGAVCAKNLAEAGIRVLVVDKSNYLSPEHFPMSEESAGHFLEAGGALVSDDGSVNVAAGTAWGGGGTINWSASLQTQGFVRKEWAQDKGLKFFETAEFQTCLDRVCHRMGVSTEHIRHNHGNKVLLEGSRKLGYHAHAVPQNTGGKEHYCGHCILGCGSNEKQGPAVSWLPDAANAGAKFVEGFKVDRVLFDKSNSTKAIGVEGVWTSRNSKGGLNGPISERTVRKVIVNAKKVIISSGTLWSPIILMNSGLKNRHIGSNLHLHPVNFVAAVFKEDVRPWEGGILTSVCTSFENLDGHGHGAKLETTVMLPSLFLVHMNWINGLTWKTNALKFRNMNGFISIVRDRDTGRIYPDPVTGLPRVQYTPSVFDRANCMEGLVALAKIAYVSGATEIRPFIQNLPPFVRGDEDVPSDTATVEDLDPGVTDARFGAWLAELQRIGNKPPIGSFTSAHQMGTNRMSAQEKDGVVDSKGRVWGTEGLYVSDASIFPSASGVNPMITNMAISDWISRNIAKELRGGN